VIELVFYFKFSLTFRCRGSEKRITIY